MNIIDVNPIYFDLDKTFDCGQCFRWEKCNDGYIGLIDSDVVYIENNNNKIITDANSEQITKKLYPYLTLNFDYETANKQLRSINKDFLTKSVNFGEGLRLLKQNIWETTVTFIISQRNNMPRIKGTVNKLSALLGTPNSQYYIFPTPEQILDGYELGILQKCSLGYRLDYVVEIAKAFHYNKFDISDSLSGDETIKELMKYKGIGTKVASCISLFGFGKIDSFPIDVWMQRIIDNHFDGNIDISSFAPYQGLAQQYMFYFATKNHQEI